MFRNRYASAPQNIMRLYDLGETQDLYRLAHTLKGVAGSLAADEAFRAARTLEITLQNNSTSDVREMAETLADCIKSALIAAESVR